MPETAAWLREQAERCIRLANATTDADVIRRLRGVAAEYLERADAFEAEAPPETTPAASTIAQPTVQQQQQVQPKDDGGEKD